MEAILIAIVTTLAAGMLVAMGRGMLSTGFSKAQSKFGKGHNVSGHWKAQYTKKVTPCDEEAELRQVLHWVSGSIDNARLKRTYKVRGTVFVDVLVATYTLEREGNRRPKHNKLDCGSFTVRISPEANRMSGQYSWMDSSTEAPESGAYEWQRV